MGRKFTILDAMILVAASALAFAWTRAVLVSNGEGSPFSPGPLLLNILWWSPLAVPSLMSASLAIFILDSRRSWHGRPRLPRRPGGAACGIAVAAGLIECLHWLVGSGLSRIPGVAYGGGIVFQSFSYRIAQMLTDVGFGVIGAWLALAPFRYRGDVPRWIEWSGRFLGVCWIILFSELRIVASILSS